MAGGVDTLFTVSEGTEAEIFHLSNRPFTLNSQPHRLLLFKQLTREMAAQEVAIWKKVIRVIAHELNNSLAPISSLAHSGRELALQPDPARLTRVFSTIEERASHLATFIDGYARFAKLPRPRPRRGRTGGRCSRDSRTACRSACCSRCPRGRAGSTRRRSSRC